MPYRNIDMVKIGSGFDLSSVRSSYDHLRAISQEIPQPPITKISLKINCQKFHFNHPECNELILRVPISSVMGPQEFILEPLLLTWINFNPKMDKQSHVQ